jgi:rhodanese-related sulfurtransferase
MKQGARRFSLFALAQMGVFVAVGTALLLAYGPWRWGRLKEEVRARFPSVPRLTTVELDGWHHKPEAQPLLLDARSEAEYNASRIPGARRADLSPAQLGIAGKFDQPLVIYCSVGFDSAPVAVRYLAQGYQRVQFLEGGIFLWANEGRPLENSQGATDKVEAAESRYLSFLDRRHRLR